MSEKERKDLEEILKLLRQGNFREAKECNTKCQGILFKMGIPEEVTKDIFQESLIVLYEKVRDRNFKLTAKLCTYLCSICKKMALYWFRTNKKHVRIKDYHKYIEGQNTTRVFDDVLDLPSNKEISDAIDSLGFPCKDVLSAFYYHNFSMKEIMEEFDYKSVDVAKVAKHKCMKRLKDKLIQKKS